ncbi:MAG: hypothetical protein Q4F56_02755 [Candidatus Saccharibacteria bacterium]|nr:hypothetical protein [Candidatus Saccharibacteria bacterium]
MSKQARMQKNVETTMTAGEAARMRPTATPKASMPTEPIRRARSSRDLDWQDQAILRLTGISETLSGLTKDHEVRIQDLEERLSSFDWEEPSAAVIAKATGPSVVEPKPEPGPKPEPEPVAATPEPEPAPEPEPKAKVDLGRPKYVPAQMFEFWDCGLQLWRGPVASLAAAKQAGGGVNSNWRIVWCWVEPDTHNFVGYMSPGDILRYCPK